MLNPNTDRLDYGRLLSPPAGYTVEFAVGTTYSLDLDALVGAAFALGLGMETDSSLLENRVFLLEALRRISDKAVLFCQEGQIYLPGKPTPLLILLENMVFPIRPRKRAGNAAPLSFHPKFWLIHYRGEHGDNFYRFLILSRNLTFDRSWDAAWQMDGRQKKKKNPRSAPLSDFLRFLQNNIPSGTTYRKKAKALLNIADEISCTHFHLDEPFYNYAFLPSGIPQRGALRPSFLGEDTFTGQ